jgi:hypothetical protein
MIAKPTPSRFRGRDGLKLDLRRTSQMSSLATSPAMMDTAWSILEAANDLGDRTTVEVCRRVIDAILLGMAPLKSDIEAIFDFFD